MNGVSILILMKLFSLFSMTKCTLAKLPEVPEELMSFLKPVTFKNWARTVIVTVLEGRPRTVEDVVAIVNFARPRNLKVKYVH